jgi:hypothetical protein
MWTPILTNSRLTREDGGLEGFTRWKAWRDAMYNSEFAKQYAAAVERYEQAWSDAKSQWGTPLDLPV